MAAVTSFLPIISAVGSVFQAFSGAGSASNAGAAQAAAMNYNAAVARNNAIAAEQAAAANAKQQTRLNLAKEAKLEAGILHNGVLLEGTPLLLIGDMASQGELEKQKILHQGQVQAANYRSQAAMDEYQASVASAAGNNRASGILTGGIFSGLSTVGNSLFKN